jgi:hypothetical protein
MRFLFRSECLCESDSSFEQYETLVMFGLKIESDDEEKLQNRRGFKAKALMLI